MAGADSQERALTIPTTEPLEILAGDTLQWTRSLPDYPATSGWTLKYRLINSLGKIDIIASASGADHAITVTAATSAAYTPGTYTWTSYVEKGAGATLERYTIAIGTITVKPSLATQAAGLDTRTHVKKVLDSIEAVIEGRATRTDLEYEIAGRRIRHMTPQDLITWRNYYKTLYRQELSSEQGSLGKTRKNRILTRL